MEQTSGKIKRIALIGPESTAKSTLARDLARHFNTHYVAEYARTYLQNINRPYTLEDILKITQEQFLQEQQLLPQCREFIFVDTEAIIHKVWCQDVFKTCPPWIEENIKNYPYDLYLLTYPDLPWQPDPLRENPHRRMFFFEWYELELQKIKANYTIIKGVDEIRIKTSIETLKAATFLSLS